VRNCSLSTQTYAQGVLRTYRVFVEKLFYVEKLFCVEKLFYEKLFCAKKLFCEKLFCRAAAPLEEHDVTVLPPSEGAPHSLHTY